MSNAFCVLPLRKSCFCWLIFKAEDPRDGKIKYFMEKCLPFGKSISCSHYQKFSNALCHIMEHRTKNKAIMNYLHDFLFAAIAKWICDNLIKEFFKLCEQLCIPHAYEKTEWGSTLVVFLGILLNGEKLVLSIPLEKRTKALNLLNDLIGKRRITIKQLQVLTGYLNFLTKAIVLGRMFTRCIYNKYANLTNSQEWILKPHHHIAINNELRFDCEIWRVFLSEHMEASVCRPMIDVNHSTFVHQINFASDASANSTLGFGAIFKEKWIFSQWEKGYIASKRPSIEYLELFALCATILTWGHELANQRVIVQCDNSSVVSMINVMSSSCRKCMFLLRLLTLNNMIFNRRVFAQHLRGLDNKLPDALSRLQFKRFWSLAPPYMNKKPCLISPMMWPASKLWQK